MIGWPRQLLALAAWLLVTYAAAAVGAVASAEAEVFFAQLDGPRWAPPAWLFAPVWTVLYTAMGVAAWLVWREGGWRNTPVALTLYLIQLLLNALWTWLFFAARMGGVAFLEIVLLWALIAATLALFWRVRPLAGALLVPYLLWVSYAAALSYVLWQANPELLAATSYGAGEHAHAG